MFTNARSAALTTTKYLLPLLLLLLPFFFFDKGARMEILLGDGDTFVHTLPVWTYVGEQWKSLSPPLWTPHIFSGYPLYAEPQTAAFHPTKVFFLFLSPLAAVNISVLFAYGMAGIWTFLLARAEGLTVEAAFLAGFAFAFCGYLVGHQAMTGLLVNAAWFPALFFILRRLARTTNYWTVAGGACVILLLVLGGHPQLTFYALFFSLLYAAYLAAFELGGLHRWAFLRASGLMYLTGICVSAFQWIPTLELSSRTFREELTYEVFANPSTPFPSLVTSLISTRLFHRFPDAGSETMLDLGFPILLLAGLALVYRRRAGAFWLILLVIGSILYMGATTPLYRIMFYLPGYNLFRMPSRNGIAIELALVMLAAHGLSSVQRRSRAFSRYLIVITPLALVLLYYLGVHRVDEVIFNRIWWAGEGKPVAWDSHTFRDILLPLTGYFAVIAASVVLMAIVLQRWGSGRTAALVMLGLSFAHFWSYRDWIFTATRQQIDESLTQRAPFPVRSDFHRTAFGASGNWISFLDADPKDWHRRYAATSGPDFSLLHRTFSISGYGPLIRRDYSRLAGDMTTSGTIQNPAILGSSTLDLLGVKYVCVPKGDLALPEAAFSSFEYRSSDEFMTIYENPRALPMFWGVSTLEPGSLEEFWARLASGKLDVARSAMLTQQPPPPLKPNYSLPDRVEIRGVSGNRLDLRVETAADSFLASSQLAYPGWRAWIDGRSATLHEINGLFLGLEIPPGKHAIHLRFIPLTLCIGLLFAAMVILLFTYTARRNLLRLGVRGQES